MIWRAVSSHKSNVGRNPVDNDANNNSRQGFVQRWAPADSAIVNPVFVIPSWLVYEGGGAIAAQTPDPYSWVNSYSIEYPAGSGTYYQIKWNGSPTIATSPGTGNYASDPLFLTIPAGAAYGVKDWGRATNLRVPVATATFSGGALVSTQITDPGVGLNTTAPVFGSNAAPLLTAAIPTGAGSGSGAVIAPVVSGGLLTGLNLTPGNGYTDGTYPIVFANGANMSRCPYKTTGDWANHGTNLPDLTMSPTTHVNDQLGFVAPMLILGQAQPGAASIGLAMDSICDGTADTTTGTSGWVGAFEKSIGRQHGKIEVGQSGQTLANYNNGHAGVQAMLLPSITHFVCGLVRNDVGVGATLASLQAAVRAVWAPYLAAGIKVYQVTCLPTTTSTDNWATTTNQTVNNAAVELVRVQFNTWLRASAELEGVTVIDLCNVIESGLNTGLFSAAAGGGKSATPTLVFSGGVVTSGAVQSGILYPANSAIPLEVFYPEGAPGSGLALTANTDGSGNVTSVTVNNGGTGQDPTRPPAVGLPGAYTFDGVHPSAYGHFKLIQAGLFAPSRFRASGSLVVNGTTGHVVGP